MSMPPWCDPSEISIHALLAESDLCHHISKNAAIGFLSTLSLRRATIFRVLSTPAAFISIHALLAESDFWLSAVFLFFPNFYPRSPCGERPAQVGNRGQCAGISIHALLAESDGYRPASWSDFRDFYPRSPCGERRYNSGLRAYFHHISIHALLAESDSFLK